MDKVYFFFFLNSFSMNKPEKVPVCATKQAALRPLLMCSYHHSLYQDRKLSFASYPAYSLPVPLNLTYCQHPG